MYCLVMFPYPSGNGLHIGHAYNYALVDSYCRWQRYKGIDVFQPFGYDAFGLPAENYARKHNRDPREVTYENIDKFRLQMQKMSTNFDEKLITSDPSYVKWTQWLFTLMKDNDLAYKAMGIVNYCPSCATVLANEQVKDEKCERCSTPIEKRELEQWYFRLSKYADRLLKNLDWLDYPEGTIKAQREWIGKDGEVKLHDWCVSRQRKWGCPIPIEGEEDTLDTFVDSSFYFLRYLTNSEDELIPAKDYKQVDLYIGGNEHACMHLIYARFVNMVLFDLGYIPNEEPFKRVVHQGMITNNGEKMSKSRGNVINPDSYDSDELRMYLMFIGHYFDGGSWDDSKISGIKRFIYRFSKWLAMADEAGENIDFEPFKTRIDGFVESFKFNKVISSFMEFYNTNKNKRIHHDTANELKKMLVCFAPNFK